jgi:hypothetical protein
VERESVYVNEPIGRRTVGKRTVAVHLGLAVLLAAATLVAVNAAGSSARSLSTREAAKAAGVVPQATGCSVTFTNPGPPALTACVSGQGNINDLSYGPFTGPVDHVNVEGYCLFDLGTGAVYYDISLVQYGWGAATQSSTAIATSVTRTTTDGIYTLTQNIFFKYGSRLVLVGNLLKNNDTVSHAVRFNRYADFNVDGSPSGDVFDTAGASVFAQEANGVFAQGANGVALTSLGNPALVQAFGAEAFGSFANPRPMRCAPTFTAPPTAPGDYVAVIQHSTTIAPGATVNFRVGYRLL